MFFGSVHFQQHKLSLWPSPPDDLAISISQKTWIFAKTWYSALLLLNHYRARFIEKPRSNTHCTHVWYTVLPLFKYGIRFYHCSSMVYDSTIVPVWYTILPICSSMVYNSTIVQVLYTILPLFKYGIQFYHCSSMVYNSTNFKKYYKKIKNLKNIIKK